MKYTISCTIWLLFSVAGKAQPTYRLSDFSSVTIHLEKPDAPLWTPSFRSFEIIDDRADTSRIGIHTFVPTFGNSHDRQLILERPAAIGIAAWLNEKMGRPDAPFTCLIVLRNLWLSDANYIREDKMKNPDISDERTHIRVKAEIYAVRDSIYIPILRYDTVQSYKRSNPYNNLATYYSLWNRDLTAVLKDMVDSASGLTPARAVHGRQLRLQDILQFNRSRFNAAITDTNALSRGVYASFGEFRNNRPSIQNFEIRQEKKDRFLYIKDANGSSYYSHDAWGYCDGKVIYIMRDGRLCPLWKEGKAFYFLGEAYKETTVNGQYYSPGTPPASAPNGAVVPGSAGGRYSTGPRKVTGTAQRIYTVDMDSGNAY